MMDYLTKSNFEVISALGLILNLIGVLYLLSPAFSENKILSDGEVKRKDSIFKKRKIRGLYLMVAGFIFQLLPYLEIVYFKIKSCS